MNSIKVSMKLPSTMINKVKIKAKRKYGFSIPQLTRHLFAHFLDQQQEDEYIHPDIAQEILEAEQDFYKAEKEGTVMEAHSAEEHVKLLEETIADEKNN